MSEQIETLSIKDRNILLTAILLTYFFTAVTSAGVNIALPQIASEYSFSAVSLSWIAMAYLLSTAIFLVPLGKAADIIGRKKVFLWGNLIFSISSVLCSFSTGDYTFIAFRFIQGIGGAMLMGTGMALITSAYPPNERGKAIGLTVSAVYLGLTLAPALGGILTETWGWRSIFYANFVAGIMVLGFIVKIKGDWAEAKNESFDYSGAFVYIVSIFVLMFGLSKLPKVYAIILTLTGIAGLVSFIMLELKTDYPVLNMQLFRQNKLFAFSNLSALMNYSATFAITFLLSLYLQYAKKLSPKEAGALLVTQSAFMTLVAWFAGRLSDRFESRILASLGMGIILSGLILMIFISQGTGYVYLILCLIAVGVGFGFFSSPNTNAIMGSVDNRFLGVASATTSTMRSMGQMISMTIAAMIIHIFMGDAQISDNNIDLFLLSMRTLFVIFAIICFAGIFTSLNRNKFE